MRRDGRYDEAALALQKMLESKPPISGPNVLEASVELGILQWNIGQIQKSEDTFSGAEVLAGRIGDKAAAQFCDEAVRICGLYIRAKELRSQDKYAESVESFNEAISIARRIKSREFEVKCLRQLSANAWSTGRLDLYLDQNRRALELAEAIHHQGEISVCHNNIGLYYWKSSDYSQALKHLQAALEIAERNHRGDDAADSMTNLGLIYLELGDYENAQGFIRRALDFDAAAGEASSLAIDYNNLGLVQKNRGSAARDEAQVLAAAESFTRALDFAIASSNRYVQCAANSNLGEAFASLGRPFQAIKYFNAALNLALHLDDREVESQIYDNLARIYFELGFRRLAQAFYERAIDLASQGRFANPLWEAYFGLGRCLEDRKDLNQAIACYRRAIEIIDHTRGRLLLEAYKVGYVKNKLKVYERLIQLLWENRASLPRGDFEASLFDCIEKIKARAFLEGLSESSIDPLSHIDDARRKLLVEAMARVSSGSFELARQEGIPANRAAAARALAKEENDYFRLLSNLKSENPELAALGSPEPIALKTVQGFIDDRTAVVEYFLGESRSYALFMTKTAASIRELPSRADIERQAAPYIKLISDPPQKGPDLMSAARRLGEVLQVGFLSEMAGQWDTLIIIPDGILHFLPFEALVDREADGSSRYLIDRYAISYAPSASVLIMLKTLGKNLGRPRGILAFGNPDYGGIQARLSEAFEPKAGSWDHASFRVSPLPFSGEEIEAIAGFFPPSARKVYLGNQAGEKQLKENSRAAYQVIHFACHGLIDEVLPYRSALLLSSSGASGEDGILHVWELYNLRLRANLVILSACQTGLGAIEKAEGVLGLTRIFFYTGASSVLSTLWSINDRPTATLMKSFYGHLSQGLSKGRALREAKLEMMRSRSSHPYYWAGFIISGEASSGIDFKD